MTCCDGKGYRWVYPIKPEEFNTAVVFRCDCGVGRSKFSVGIPMWQPHYEKRYTDKPYQPKPTETVVPESTDLVKPTFSPQEIELIKTIRVTKEFGNSTFVALLKREGKEAIQKVMREP